MIDFITNENDINNTVPTRADYTAPAHILADANPIPSVLQLDAMSDADRADHFIKGGLGYAMQDAGNSITARVGYLLSLDNDNDVALAIAATANMIENKELNISYNSLKAIISLHKYSFNREVKTGKKGGYYNCTVTTITDQDIAQIAQDKADKMAQRAADKLAKEKRASAELESVERGQTARRIQATIDKAMATETDANKTAFDVALEAMDCIKSAPPQVDQKEALAELLKMVVGELSSVDISVETADNAIKALVKKVS